MAYVPMGDPDPSEYRARSYQLEMFEASLKTNIIVAMGTGSGKTHIALLRISHELEHSDGSKLIWFLAPTVALCLQQHKLIARYLPTARSRTLTGLDKVELWTDQEIWDDVLDDMQIVVSTPAVLLDAMTHGFVRISRLGLIIFDEAHHCTRNHPANNIMRLFYHPALTEHGPDAVPKILGLTASAAGNLQGLKVIEANLNSVCTTPQAHRHELLEHTHRPELRQILYTPLVIEGISSFGGASKALIEAYGMLRLEDDPYVKRLRASSPHGEALQKVLETGNTYCSDQLKRFVRRAIHIFTELGVWAADYFIWASTEQLRKKAFGKEWMDLEDDEKKYLVDILSKLPKPDLDVKYTDPADFPVSPKFEALISFLLDIDAHDFSGLIFVQQRATVAVMAHLLAVHPLIKDRFRTGGFIGMSNSTKKKDILGDLLTVNMQRDTLDDFRDGRKNLIVATDVLEEGIDVSACSLVVCYDKPPNLKSFVQRRGRARRQYSTYAMVLSTQDDDLSLRKWHNVEKAMEEAYQEDRRRLEEVRALEDVDEDVHARFRVESTGATLTADNAMQHLFHFCSTLPFQANVENKPEFSFEYREGDLLKGKVTLPSCVIPAARRATGTSWWKTERAAKKEAAFQAYRALYEHGLVNDNLLPLTKSREFTRKDLDSVPAIQYVKEQYDPWTDWADAWLAPTTNLHRSRITIRQDGKEWYMIMVTPDDVPMIEPMTLFWDSETTYTVEFTAAEPVQTAAQDIESMRAITALYLQATTTRRLSGNQDFITIFSLDLPPAELVAWLNKNQGHEPAKDVFTSQRSYDCMGLVRDHSRYDEILLLKRWVESDDGLKLECYSYPKRRNLLQKHNLVASTKRPASNADETDDITNESLALPSTMKTRIISAETATISNISATESIFGRFIAVISDRLEAALVATKLSNTILPGIAFTELRHIITAITMPLAQGPTHYQRYEFFGDSVLKFTVACELYFAHPNWHEGYLTQALHALVQNGRLARAALDTRLDKFIIARRFLPRKWSAPLILGKRAVEDDHGIRAISSKVLADVVEALIGAAYIDGGHEMARAIIQRFLPDLHLTRERKPTTDADTNTPMPGANSCPDQPTQGKKQTPHLINHAPLEAALGYTFKDKSILLEALTHPSVQHDSSTQSYQRLEFLGDAVLDMLIVEMIRLHPRELNQGDMTRIKHALVNADLLGFFCLEFGFPLNPALQGTDPAGGIRNGKKKDDGCENMKMHLYTYIRHSPSTPLFTDTKTRNIKIKANANDTKNSTALTRYSALRDSILTHLSHGKTYPWLLVSSLHSDKVLSDIIESILGAIYVDSSCNLEACRRFIERLGLASYAKRVLDDKVDVLHPMQRVQITLARLASRLLGPEAGWKFEFTTLRVAGQDQDHVELRETVEDDEATGDIETDTNTSAAQTATTDSAFKYTYTYTCTISLSGLNQTPNPDLNLDLDDVTVHGCISKEEAEVRAALAVLEVLQERQLQVYYDVATATTTDNGNAGGDEVPDVEGSMGTGE